jgi:hypothetical protein
MLAVDRAFAFVDAPGSVDILTTMLRSIPLTHLITGIVTLGAAHACYYYYYIEDPNNFAYRYCSVGVSLG